MIFLFENSHYNKQKYNLNSLAPKYIIADEQFKRYDLNRKILFDSTLNIFNTSMTQKSLKKALEEAKNFVFVPNHDPTEVPLISRLID